MIGAGLALAAALAHATAAADREREWRFRVEMDGAPIGHHVYRVGREGSGRRVESEARFNVKFLFVDAYRYEHTAQERWRGDCLEAMQSRTDDNGERTEVRGKRGESAFLVETSRVRSELPHCVMSFAYWNKKILEQSRLLNAQTGELVDVKVEPLGTETIDVRGTPTPAQRFALRAATFRIDVWYSEHDRWVQLESRTAGGKALRYLIH